jgi:sporulation protein YlmC with PRC-barrel domain
MNENERGQIGPEGYPEGTAVPEPGRLVGAAVLTADGARIGIVEDVYVDAEDRYIRYIAVVADDRAPGRRVLPIDEMSAPGEGMLRVPYGLDDLHGAPSVARDEALTPEREEDVYGHFGRTGYWEDIRARQRPPAPTPQIARAEGQGVDDVAARQTEPAPTPEIAEAEVEAALRRDRDPRRVRVRRWGL